MTTLFVLVVLIVAVGAAVVVVRNRSDQGIESGISSFRREMRALAPRPGETDPSAPSHRPHPVDQDPGVHLLGDRRPEPDAPSSGATDAPGAPGVDDPPTADDPTTAD